MSYHYIPGDNNNGRPPCTPSRPCSTGGNKLPSGTTSQSQNAMNQEIERMRQHNATDKALRERAELDRKAAEELQKHKNNYPIPVTNWPVKVSKP
jgi:hypothetical protein